MPSFDLVDEFERFALRGNQVKPAACNHERRRQTEHPVGNRVATVVIVKKPRVDVAFPQRGLNGWKIHEQMVILNKYEDLGECSRSLRPGLMWGRQAMPIFLCDPVGPGFRTPCAARDAGRCVEFS